MPVQQRLVEPVQLRQSRERVRGRNRRRLIDAIVGDVADGAHSLGELDVAAACRRHGLPEPDRQTVRTTTRGRLYLDVRWRNGLVVEIDGAAHSWGLAAAADALRANAVTLAEEMVLRVELVGWRLDEDAYMSQIRAGYWIRESRTTAAAV